MTDIVITTYGNDVVFFEEDIDTDEDQDEEQQ